MHALLGAVVVGLHQTSAAASVCLPAASASAGRVHNQWACACACACRHEVAVIAALLHDVLDDTPTTPEALTAAFGPAVTAMVIKVSKLSAVNQMLRRDKRTVGVARQLLPGACRDRPGLLASLPLPPAS